MEAVALGIAINLASALMVAGTGRLRAAALGDEQKQVLEKAFAGATAAMMVEVARNARLDRELPGRLEERFGKFFGDQWVAETLVGVALDSEAPPVDRLCKRYEELGFDLGELPISFERAMGLFARELALRLREDARSGGPLVGVVVVADVEAMRGMMEELVRDWGEKEQELTESQRGESLARCEAAWAAYERGPGSSTDDVFFAGFFVPSGPKGRLAHGGNARSMEMSFFATFSDTMAEHRLNSTGLAVPGVRLPIRVLDRRPPEGFAEARDYEGFERLTGRWAKGCLGVVWGTLREDGKIERFEVAVDPGRYYGGPLYERGLERIRRVAEREDLPHQAVVRYLAKALAAIWCQGYCDVLNRLERWDEAIPVVADSERFLREALEELEEDAGSRARGVIEAQRRALLPPGSPSGGCFAVVRRAEGQGARQAVRGPAARPLGSHRRPGEVPRVLQQPLRLFSGLPIRRFRRLSSRPIRRRRTLRRRSRLRLRRAGLCRASPVRPAVVRGLDLAGRPGRRGSRGQGRRMVL